MPFFFYERYSCFRNIGEFNALERILFPVGICENPTSALLVRDCFDVLRKTVEFQKDFRRRIIRGPWGKSRETFELRVFLCTCTRSPEAFQRGTIIDGHGRLYHYGKYRKRRRGRIERRAIDGCGIEVRGSRGTMDFARKILLSSYVRHIHKCIARSTDP